MIYLYNIRILAIFMVCFLHVTLPYLGQAEWGTPSWWYLNFYGSITRSCVPLLVMVSGALLLNPNKNYDNDKIFYKKRVAKIVIPLLFWSLFEFAWIMTLNFKNTGTPAFFTSIIKVTHSHLWFIYMLLFLYLLTPFFRKFMAALSYRKTLVITVIMFLLVVINKINDYFFTPGNDLFINSFLSYIPYFFSGYLIVNSSQDYSRSISLAIFILSVLFTTIGVYYTGIKINFQTAKYFYDFNSVSIIPMSISFMCLLRCWNIPIFNFGFTQKLSSLTFGVYLIHMVFISVIPIATGYILKRLDISLPTLNVPIILWCPFYAVCVFVVSAVVAFMILKIPCLKRII